MKSFTAKISSRGRVILPSAVRKHLGVTARDKVTFVMEDDGRVTLVRSLYPTVASLRGIAGKLPHSLDWESILQIAHDDYAVEEYGHED